MLQSHESIRSFLGPVLEPGVITVQDAMLTPSAFNKTNMTYTGAVYGPNGSLILDSLRPAPPMASYRPVAPVWVDRKEWPISEREKAAIYGGHFFYAWGHFLLETISTAYAANDAPNVPVVFSPWAVTFKNEWTDNFIAHVTPILRAAGWGDRDIQIDSNARRFEQLIIPKRITSIGDWRGSSLHAKLADIFDRVRIKLGGEPERGKTLVGMRPITHRRRHPSEGELYDLLRDRGCETVFLHEMTAADQVEKVSSAETLIAFSGSTLHNSAFLKRGGKVVEIGDAPTLIQPVPTQVDLCAICEQEHQFIAGHVDGSALTAQQIADQITL